MHVFQLCGQKVQQAADNRQALSVTTSSDLGNFFGRFKIRLRKNSKVPLK